jgi:uncharacterized SAM-binding protein YcdF (DUF218 family)
MFYLLSKTLAYVLTPAGWLFGTLAYAVFTKNRTHKHRAVIGALGLLLFFGNGFIVNGLVNAWQGPDRGLPTDSLARVGVVLTGGMINPNTLTNPSRPVLADQSDRAGEALYLYRRGIIRTIIISGGSGSQPFRERPLHDEGQQVAEFLRLAGVRPTDIVLENASKNTYENARFSARLLLHRFHTDHCVLITSALHLRRAEACFLKQGLHVSAFSANFIGSTEGFSLADLLPHEEMLHHSYWLLRELTGFVTYKLAGYC